MTVLNLMAVMPGDPTCTMTSNGKSKSCINRLYFWYDFNNTNKSSWYFLLLVLLYANNISSLLGVNI
jgi:hypothetical protein